MEILLITDGQKFNTSICLTIYVRQRDSYFQKQLGHLGCEGEEEWGRTPCYTVVSRREKYVIVTLDYYTNPSHLDTLQRDA